MKPKTKTIIGGCAAALVIVAVLLCAGYWLVFDTESPLNRESAFATVYEWARLSPIPNSSTNVSISAGGTMFSRAFTLEFDAPKADISSWLSNSPGTIGVTPTTTPKGEAHYQIDPGGGAQKAELFVSPDGTHVRVYTYWS